MDLKSHCRRANDLSAAALPCTSCLAISHQWGQLRTCVYVHMYHIALLPQLLQGEDDLRSVMNEDHAQQQRWETHNVRDRGACGNFLLKWSVWGWWGGDPISEWYNTLPRWIMQSNLIQTNLGGGGGGSWFSLSEVLLIRIIVIHTCTVLQQTNKAGKIVCAKQKFGSRVFFLAWASTVTWRIPTLITQESRDYCTVCV